MKDRQYAVARVVGLIGVVLVGLGAWYWWTRLSPGAILRAVEANNVALVEALIRRGADLTVRDDWGRKPAHVAASLGHVDVLSVLLDGGVDVDERGAGGCTPLHEAARWGMPGSAALLLSRGAEVNAADADGCTPLSWVAAYPWRKGAADVARILLENGADPSVGVALAEGQEVTPLEYALRGRSWALAEVLLQHGEAESGFPYIGDAASSACTEVMRLLIQKGADVNQRYSDDRTPLFEACYGGHPGAVASLLDEGADVNAANSEGRTPLMEAADRGHAEVVSILVERGANPAATDKDGWTALDLVVGRRERIEALLRKHGALTGAELRAGQRGVKGLDAGG